MPTQEQLKEGFRIGDWEVLPARRVMRSGDREISPEPKVFGVLIALAMRGGDVVTRDELIDEVWDGRATGDEPINRCISQLRHHLGDTRPYRYIKPVTGSGYLLQAPVVLPAADEPPAVPGSGATRPRRLWPAVLATAVIAVASYLIWMPTSGPIRSIVVLPFENLSDQQFEYLGSGFRDELAKTLQQIKDFSVKTGRGTHTDQTAEEIGRAYGVDSVLRGIVQRSGDELKVSYEVSDGRSGNLIAANGITDNIERVFDVQERLARLVREDLFGASQQHLVSASRPVNFDAYNSYLQGLYAFERRGYGQNLEDAMRLFEETIASDPSFGPAYLQLATATALMPVYMGADRDVSNQLAIEIVEEGISADDSIEDAAGAVFGFVYHSQKDWTKSELAYQQATKAAVVDANAFNWYSRMLASVGRLDASLEQAKLAWEMEPDNPVINSRMALSYFWLGDAVNAADFFDRSRRLGVAGTTHQLGYAMFLADQGNIDDASSVAKTAAGEAGFPVDWVDAVMAGIGDPEFASEGIQAVNESVASGQLTPQIEIVARTLLGDVDGAMRTAKMLEQPGEAFAMDLLWLPQFRALREHPDFPALMQNLGIAEYWSLHGCRYENAKVFCPPG